MEELDKLLATDPIGENLRDCRVSLVVLRILLKEFDHYRRILAKPCLKDRNPI